MRTGVCYYPEHWPEERWAVDARQMREIGLRVIRIGEFAWSRLENQHGELSFDWLERAIDTLHAEGLSVVLGTPTATPPRWMLDRHPSMLAVDENGRQRDFGSRRHYCFSYEPYISECERIVTLLAERFGQHPAIVAWQTDNEYGCHETSISYSQHALSAFHRWCKARYHSIDALNKAWGNVFWSMEYDHFEQIGLPVGTVTESNPAHQLAFWRFSSDQIKHFNKVQVDIIKQHAPHADVLHNFMGNFVEFDHHDVAKDLDIATWDNYPLGFLTRDNTDARAQQMFARTGHPDGSSFHHDLYRGCCNGRWWVMEQQPGPVNWAPYNPSPIDGMVRLWGWEAFAHGAEVMSYFRWRQAPFAQEQTHTALLLPDASEDVAAREIRQLSAELEKLSSYAKKNGIEFRDPSRPADKTNIDTQIKSDVAIVLSYSGIAIQDIQSPGGETFSALVFCQQAYSAVRQWGVNVDVVSPDADLSTYKLVILCTSTENTTSLVENLKNANERGDTVIALFPGTASRNEEYQIPNTLAPGLLQKLLDVKVVRSESLPPHERLIASDAQSNTVTCHQWRERIESELPPKAIFQDGWGFHYQQDRIHYINSIPESTDLISLTGSLLAEAGVAGYNLGPYLRTQKIGPWRVAFNYGEKTINLTESTGKIPDYEAKTTLIIGSKHLNQGEVAVWVVR